MAHVQKATLWWLEMSWNIKKKDTAVILLVAYMRKIFLGLAIFSLELKLTSYSLSVPLSPRHMNWSISFPLTWLPKLCCTCDWRFTGMLVHSDWRRVNGVSLSPFTSNIFESVGFSELLLAPDESMGSCHMPDCPRTFGCPTLLYNDPSGRTKQCLDLNKEKSLKKPEWPSLYPPLCPLSLFYALYL